MLFYELDNNKIQLDISRYRRGKIEINEVTSFQDQIKILFHKWMSTLLNPCIPCGNDRFGLLEFNVSLSQ